MILMCPCWTGNAVDRLSTVEAARHTWATLRRSTVHMQETVIPPLPVVTVVTTKTTLWPETPYTTLSYGTPTALTRRRLLLQQKVGLLLVQTSLGFYVCLRLLDRDDASWNYTHRLHKVTRSWRKGDAVHYRHWGTGTKAVGGWRSSNTLSWTTPSPRMCRGSRNRRAPDRRP